MGDLLIRRARLNGRSVDVRIAGGRIVDVVDTGGSPRREAPAGANELDAAGGFVLPGIHDHHIHLRALAAARASVAAGPPEVTARAQLENSLVAAAGSGARRWIRAVGYHESVAGDLDRNALDRMVADRPVRVQHRSGILWVLNSMALEILAADSDPSTGIERDSSGRPTGRLWRMDDWLSKKTAWLPEYELLTLLGELSERAVAAGVTGWTDATPGRSDDETAVLAGSVARASIKQRLHLMVRPDAPVGLAAGGDGEEPHPLVTTGAVKVLLDDFDLPPLESLVETVRSAHHGGRPVAIHCVSRTQIVLAVAALEEAGTPVRGDRIEHGAVIPPELIPRLRRGGATVVTQPNFVHERGDSYLRDVEPEEFPNLWRAASLTAQGVAVAAGTDAPFGREDPWGAIRAATTRMTAAGVCLGEAERVDAGQAFAWFCGWGPEPARARRVAPGEPADLFVMAASLEEVVDAGGPPPVVTTVVGGQVVYP